MTKGNKYSEGPVSLFGPKDVIGFGKYNGKRVEEVMLVNPEYLIWAHQQVRYFNMDPHTLLVVKELMKVPKDHGEWSVNRARESRSRYDDGSEDDVEIPF